MQAAPTPITNESHFPGKDQVKLIDPDLGHKSTLIRSLQNPPSTQGRGQTIFPPLQICWFVTWQTQMFLFPQAAWQTQQLLYISLHLGEMKSRIFSHPHLQALLQRLHGVKQHGRHFIFSCSNWGNDLPTCSHSDFISVCMSEGARACINLKVWALELLILEEEKRIQDF